MRARHFTPLIALVPFVLVSCGNDEVTPSTQPVDTTVDLPSTDSTPEPDVSVPVIDADADSVVLSIGFEGGFTTPEVLFSSLPIVTVTADGRVIQLGPQIEIYPGPLLPNVLVGSMGADDLATVMSLAAEQGLLTEREYPYPTNVADAPDTVVTLTVDGVTYEHRANALGMSGGLDGRESDPDRAALAAFVDEALAILTAVPADTPYPAEHYLIRSRPVDDLSGFEIEPTVVDWPADSGVALADASGCVNVPAADFATLFEQANQLTFFTDGGVTYSLAVKPQLPGDAC